MLKLPHCRPARRNQRANVAIEFALLAPVMITMVLGVFDLSRYLIVAEEISNAAHAVVVSASILAVQQDETTSLTWAQVEQSLSQVYAEVPGIRSGLLPGAKSASLASVTFQQINSSCVPSSTVACATNAIVTWTAIYDQTGSWGVTYRACQTLTQVAANAATPGNLTLIGTAGVSNPEPIIVADIYYQFTPVFFNFITGPINIWGTDYMPVRSTPPGTAIYKQYTKFDIANQLSGGGKCAGW